MYQVINNRTGEVVSRCKTLHGAFKARGINDSKYGACVHRIIEIKKEEK